MGDCGNLMLSQGDGTTITKMDLTILPPLSSSTSLWSLVRELDTILRLKSGGTSKVSQAHTLTLRLTKGL